METKRKRGFHANPQDHLSDEEREGTSSPGNALNQNEEVEETECSPSDEPKKKKEGFFILNLLQVDEMVGKGARAEEVMAYLVQARGTGRQGFSTHGAQSVAKRTGLTHYKATQSLEWLSKHGCICRESESDESIKARRARWSLRVLPSVSELALANALVDGVGKGKDNPPLARLYVEADMGKHCVLSDARLDALMVLLHLYKHHSLSDFGGVNPLAGIYRHWQPATMHDSGNYIENIAGWNAALFEIGKDSADTHVFHSFAKEALFYISDNDERHERFWDAMHNLEKLRFLYETIQIWTANPATHPKAEPLYTLYINDSSARKTEPYLQTAIHNAAFRSGALNPNTYFAHHPGNEELAIASGQFRYIAKKKNGGFPIGIWRLRYRAPTKDTGKGMAAEKKRVEVWDGVLSRL